MTDSGPRAAAPATAPQFEAIRERADRATPGPWHSDEGFGGVWVCTEGCKSSYPVHPSPDPEEIPMPGVVLRTSGWPDADFIAHARADVPALLDALAAERASADRLAAALSRIERHLRPERERDNGRLADAYDMAVLPLDAHEARRG